MTGFSAVLFSRYNWRVVGLKGQSANPFSEMLENHLRSLEMSVVCLELPHRGSHQRIYPSGKIFVFVKDNRSSFSRGVTRLKCLFGEIMSAYADVRDFCVFVSREEFDTLKNLDYMVDCDGDRPLWWSLTGKQFISNLVEIGNIDPVTWKFAEIEGYLIGL